MVDGKLIADDRRVHAAVDGAQAVGDVVLPIQGQVRGVEARPLGRAQVDLQGDRGSATVDRYVWIAFKAQTVVFPLVTVRLKEKKKHNSRDKKMFAVFKLRNKWSYQASSHNQRSSCRYRELAAGAPPAEGDTGTDPWCHF